MGVETLVQRFLARSRQSVKEPRGERRSLVIPERIIDLLNNDAELYGTSLNSIVVDILQQHYDLHRDPAILLLRGIQDWLGEHYAELPYPPDITLLVFNEIVSNQYWSDLYIRAENQWGLNRRIGKLIKKVLNARSGDRVYISPDEHLIQSYTLLY